MNAPFRRAQLGLLFFASGAAALTCEIVWTRTLGVVLGGESIAAQAVLAAYFSGLLLGAAAGARLGRAARPLKAYGLLEVGAGVGGLWTLIAFEGVRRYAPRLTAGEYGPLQAVVAFAAAAIACLPATVCLGATLPAVVASATSRARSTPPWLNLLYGLNALGAAVGAAAAGLLLVPHLGARRTLLVAAAGELGVGLAALVLARAAEGPDPVAQPASAGGPAAPAAVRRSTPGLALALALAGFAGVSMEIAVFRVVWTVSQRSVYGFATTLTAFILGLWLAAKARPRPRSAVPWLFGATLACAATGHLLSSAGWLHALALRTVGDHGWRLVVSELATSLAIGTPAAFPGAVAFLSLAGLRARGASSAGASVATSSAANLCGAALAPVVSGLWVLNADGVHGAVLVAIVALAAAAVLADRAGVQPRSGAAAHRGAPERKLRWAPPLRGRAWLMLAAGLATFALPSPLTSWPRSPDERQLAAAEDAEGLAAVVELEGERLLRTGAQSYEGGERSAFAEARMGLLPLLLHPAPARVLALGVGSGVTLGALARYPGVQVDAVELLPAVMELLPWFSGVAGDLAHSPSVRLHRGDARSFVRARGARGDRFDVVVGDLFHPQQAGVGALYSREAFSAVRDVLAPGGLYVQWLPLHELPREDLALIVRTFLSVFPHASAWYAHFNAQASGLGLVGSERPLGLSPAAVASRLARPELGRALSGVLLDRPMELLASHVLDEGALARLGGAGPLNTDDLPLVEYSAPLGPSLAGPEHTFETLEAVRALAGPPDAATLAWGPAGAEPGGRQALKRHQEAVDALISAQEGLLSGDLVRAGAEARRAVLLAPDFRVGSVLLRELSRRLEQKGRTQEAEATLRWAAEHEGT